MSLIVRLLGTGQTTANQNTVLYLVPTTVLGAIVRNVRLVNTTGSQIMANLFYTPSGGNQVRILDKDHTINANELFVVTPELTMGPSDKIELTTSQTVNYVVSGVEKV